MPGTLNATKNPKKRKQEGKESSRTSAKRRVVADDNNHNGPQNEKDKIQELENQISESRKYYNNIVTLLSMLNAGSPNLTVGVSLCRVFCRLLAGRQLNKPKNANEQEVILVAWLRERYQEYQNVLLTLIRNGDESQQVC